MPVIDVSIVTYAPDLALLQRLLASLAEPAPRAILRNVFIQDNSADETMADRIAALPELQPNGAFAAVSIERSGRNLGFGRGHNANARRGAAPYLLVANQDCVLEPGALAGLVECAESSGGDVAAWEMRQIPYEHPKAYDPVSLEVSWVSGAATLFRRAAFDGLRGFEPRIFMYGEDVDLSWRLRANGWRLLYQPRFAVMHRTYSVPHEEKPLQLFEGVLVNLCLRARYGGPAEALRGLATLAREAARPGAVLARRWGLMKAGLRFLLRAPYFATTRVAAQGRFRPIFAGWDYEQHRDGAFVTFASRRDTEPGGEPLVSILIRTCGRPAWLRQALASCLGQTYRNLEVVVIEGGEDRSRAVVEEFSQRLRIRYHATGVASGRARNGNIALQMAKGEWLNFLDDDDLFFADHVEVVLAAALRANAAGAYGLAWEAHTRCLDRENARFEEVRNHTRHAQGFDRMLLWDHNYLPIQSVIFHRRLYDRHGGFDEGMDQLEDWNLWTRYTLDDDFVMVPKTTSKYRVPADAREAADRQAMLDRAYAAALERQSAMRGAFSPQDVLVMARRYARSRRLLARVANRLPVADRVLRRMELIE
ncbi:MAG: glycosyltransferase family 2 protein [Usitatibacter sp.]